MIGVPIYREGNKDWPVAIPLIYNGERVSLQDYQMIVMPIQKRYAKNAPQNTTGVKYAHTKMHFLLSQLYIHSIGFFCSRHQLAFFPINKEGNANCQGSN